MTQKPSISASSDGTTGNPANLNPLPPIETRQEDRWNTWVALASHHSPAPTRTSPYGQYRWVVQVLNQLVFAEPDNSAGARAGSRRARAARLYQAESATWRNAYLEAAQELRGKTPGVNQWQINTDPDSHLLPAGPPFSTSWACG